MLMAGGTSLSQYSHFPRNRFSRCLSVTTTCRLFFENIYFWLLTINTKPAQKMHFHMYILYKESSTCFSLNKLLWSLLHSLSTTVSLVQWVNLCFLSRGQRFASRGCTHSQQWNQVSPVSTVSLHWWPRRDPWSQATIGPLTLATGCFSHPSCPNSILNGVHRLLRHTAWIL
jgi:hypothetical protein